MMFEQFFQAATGHPPYDYQRRLAGGDAGRPCASQLINIPTGLGKTAAVIMAWLWNRVLIPQSEFHTPHSSWPRRLVYCLPMRTLVEQMAGEVEKWLFRLALAATETVSPSREAVETVLKQQGKSLQDTVRGSGWNAEDSLAGTLTNDALERLLWLVGVETRNSSFIPHPSSFSPVLLMGGEENDPKKAEWDIHPEKPAILIGTQDMLLSRALNRGYGMSRYRWPMHFGLLNNDCLWVFDEVQLMGSGLATTAQLEGFRNQFLTAVTARSWWMSATSAVGWFQTVDFNPATLGPTLRLEDEDSQNESVKKLLNAQKPVRKAAATSGDLRTLAQEILTATQPSNGLTLVVMNTVNRARTLRAEFAKLLRAAGPEAQPLLLHSRFRPEERAAILKQVLASEGHRRLVVSTQVIEAGVDLSTATLFTELAPWTSLVQRFGRCNRRGHEPQAQIIWFDTEDPAPYTPEQLAAARERLTGLTAAAPDHLSRVEIPEVDRPRARQVIRRKDFVELFDTTPDLAGNDLDIDRWVREIADRSVQVFWRSWKGDLEGDAPPREFPAAQRRELCPAPVVEFRDFVKKIKAVVWRWDFLDGKWVCVKGAAAFPGQAYLLPDGAGGYSSESGWNPSVKEAVAPLPLTEDKTRSEEYDADAVSEGIWQSIAQHTNDVCRELEQILTRVQPVFTDTLRLAARHHDLGKAHAVFQNAIKTTTESGSRPPEWVGRADIAKAPDGWWTRGYERPHFRHELASALVMLHPESPLPVQGLERDLAAYLVAAHHGKVRLSIRSFPEETDPEDGRRFARGIWDGDRLPPDPLDAIDLGANHSVPKLQLSLEPMELGLGQQHPFIGLPSWAERMLALRDHKGIGPFRLAFLEVLLRAADERASAVAKSRKSVHIDPCDTAGSNSAMAATSPGNPSATHVADGTRGYLSEHADGRRTGELILAEGSSRPYGSTRHLETTLGILSFSEVAERLALKAVEIRQAILAGDYAPSSLGEDIVSTLHRDLCGHLVPDWAGRWRSVAVTVGGHTPPAPHLVAQRMRDYGADLRARWDFLAGEDENLLLESLAFAEGRLLSIHPFQDFNGRVTRLFLLEILRRAELPPVCLAVHDDEEKRRYFEALRGADESAWAPLIQVWQERFSEAASSPTEP
ncbi:MAG: Fic family protein [Verrucomicrobia bacterium]|nr:Fic family protein [Verrucomicrobiota bacterium]